MRTNQPALIGRRGELLIELFLQDLGASSVVAATGNLTFDLLANFENGRGGVNVYGVVVKATGNPVSRSFPLQTASLKQIAYSSLPTMLLVANVKINRMYHAWLTPNKKAVSSETIVTSVPIIEVDDVFKEKLVKQLRSNVRDMIEIDIPLQEFEKVDSADTRERIRQKAIEVGLIGPNEDLPGGIDVEVFRGSRHINLEVKFPSSEPKAKR